MVFKMAQSKVNEYFVARKKTKGTQQSKRRRVEVSQTDDDISNLKLNVRSAPYYDSSTTEESAKTVTTNKTIAEFPSVSTPTTKQQRSNSKHKQTTTAAPKRRGRSAKILTIPGDQQLITTTFSAKGSLDLINTNFATEDIFNDTTQLTRPLVEEKSQLITVSQIENTPKKQIQVPDEKAVTVQPRRRREKLADPAPVTPENVQVQEAYSKSKSLGSVRKQLKLPNKEKVEVNHDEKESTKVPSPISRILEKELLPQISPLPNTPNNEIQKQSKGPSLPISPKVKAAMEKCKELQVKEDSSKPKTLEEKMQPEQLRRQLRKCGKLEELKAQLLQMNKSICKVKKTPKLKKFADVKITSPVKVEKPSLVDSKSAAIPAYEKYHSLATPAAATLKLPLKYQKLAETFRCMDTVVSMMHNRYEICTYSKLKNAVQVMTKKNFETHHVGQVKTVHPAAYHLKQEKGLPQFGSKCNDYQLTIEANLQSANEMKEDKLIGKHVLFSASHLLERRNVFHTELINRVKYHHKNFLDNLDKPLSIPDDKITRWHPAFPLDQVADIEAAELPQPPVVNKYHSAKDVLDERRGKLTPKVEEALENVASLNIKNEKKDIKEEPSVTVPNNAAYRGIPASLLEKIRAKEAKKLELAMTRDPEEEKKTVMMSRLPDLIRIIRTHFVTEKKPALPIDSVVKKLADSTKSNLSITDVHNHLKLLLNILPEWISMVEIKKGKYLKIGRNMDIHDMSNKITSLIKARK
ncbi:DNA replication factor Cdt1 [Patella vulgata]|uniref:DNA replication factor Cdt1 n=1 Tax=Patella vulgata TaxID=6465 RepID=UPI0024A81908|nr:DNA replication factor Cdt1 [Patella vulgata]